MIEIETIDTAMIELAARFDPGGVTGAKPRRGCSIEGGSCERSERGFFGVFFRRRRDFLTICTTFQRFLKGFYPDLMLSLHTL